MKKKIRQTAILAFWLLLWQLLALAIHNKILFTGPLDTGRALLAQAATTEFWLSIGNSFLKITLGFLLAFLTGILLAAAACRFRWLYELLEPLLGLVQSLPAASFVILALLWSGSDGLPLLISFLVVCPVIYRNVTAGIRQTEASMIEMAKVFRLSPWKRFWYLYRPAVFPGLRAGCRACLGMSWKSGVAAEVIGITGHSIGEKLYLAKIYLRTADLFAWSFVIVLLSRLFERGFLWLLDRMHADLEPGNPGSASKVPFLENRLFQALPFKKVSRAFCHAPRHKLSPQPRDIRIVHVAKAYGEKKVLKDFSFCLKQGNTYCLMGRSGVGKTTLLRLLMGVEQPDAGDIVGTDGLGIAVVFQEDRLVSFLDGVGNVRIAEEHAKGAEAEALLNELLENQELYCAAGSMSGGMKRRTALARALAFPSDILLLDEPFSGLDEASKKRALAVIKAWQKGRTLVLVTHDKEDAKRLGAEIVWLKGEV